MAKRKHKITKSVGFFLETLDEIDWLLDDNNPNRKFVSFSDAVSKLVGIGLFIVKQEGRIDSGELLKQMNGIIKDEKIMDWLQNLSSTQRIGLKEMISLIDEQAQIKLI